MIDDTDVVTFHSDNAPRTDLTWLAQVMLSNGKFWGVYFTGSSEAEVVGKAIALWNSEQERLGVNQKPKEYDPWASVPSVPPTAFAGSKWLINKATRALKRVTAEVAEQMMTTGEWERGGPRSK